MQDTLVVDDCKKKQAKGGSIWQLDEDNVRPLTHNSPRRQLDPVL